MIEFRDFKTLRDISFHFERGRKEFFFLVDNRFFFIMTSKTVFNITMNSFRDDSRLFSVCDMSFKCIWIRTVKRSTAYVLNRRLSRLHCKEIFFPAEVHL